MTEIKYILDFEFQYWINRRLDVYLYWRHSKENPNNKELMLTIWKNHRLTYIPGYEDEWGTRIWKHFTLWKFGGKHDN